MSTDQTPAKHKYRSARCYSNGAPLPEGWEVRPAGERGYQAFRDDYGPLFTSSSRKHVEGYVTWAAERAERTAARAIADRANAAAELGNGTKLPSGDTCYETYASGYPLPEGWLIRYHVDRQEYVGYRDNRSEFRCSTRDDADRRVRFFARADSRAAQLEAIAKAKANEATAKAAAAARESEVDRITALMHRRERLWFVVGAVAGLIVGGTSVGLLAYNQAPETPVTSEYCLAALGHADDLIAGYGDGLRGSMLSQPVAKSEALNAANDTVQRLTPLYEAEAMKCKVQR